jgi:hypothetical protein
MGTACAPRTAPLVDTGEIPGAFLLRQHLRVSRPDGGVAELDAVVQNGCGELLLMALTPFQTRAFVVRQRGLRIEADRAAGTALPFDPARMLVDLQRTYFVPIGDPPPGARRDVDWRGERIDETWSGGRLVERRYAHGGREQVRIAYPDGMRPGELPPRASLVYAATGYRLDVETVSRTAIDCDR